MSVDVLEQFNIKTGVGDVPDILKMMLSFFLPPKSF